MGSSAPRFSSGPVRFEFGPGSNRTRTLNFTNFKLRTGLKLNYKFGPGSVRSLQTSSSPNIHLLNWAESNFKLSSPKFEKVRKVFLWLSSLYSFEVRLSQIWKMVTQMLDDCHMLTSQSKSLILKKN